MPYDPLKALKAAGILEGPLSADAEKAIGTLSQDDVDLIISHKANLPAVVPAAAAPRPQAAWTAPQATTMSMQAAMSCMCGVWSGSGSGKEN